MSMTLGDNDPSITPGVGEDQVTSEQGLTKSWTFCSEYNDPEADFIMISSDDLAFRVHSYQLAAIR